MIHRKQSLLHTSRYGLVLQGHLGKNELFSLIPSHTKNQPGYHPPRLPALADSPVAALALALAAWLPGSADLFPRPVPAFASALFSAQPVLAVVQWAQPAPPVALTQK